MKMRILLSLILVVFLSTMVVAIPVLDQGNTPDGAWGGGVSVNATELSAQTFTQGAGLNYVTSIWVGEYQAGSLPWEVTLELRDGATGVNPLTDLPLLGSVTKTFTAAGTWQDWFRFDLPYVPVTPGNSYTFVLKGTGVGTQLVLLSTTDTYSGGNRQYSGDGGTSWSNSFGQDLTFRTYSDAVPEPATICLLGLGGLALLRKRS